MPNREWLLLQVPMPRAAKMTREELHRIFFKNVAVRSKTSPSIEKRNYRVLTDQQRLRVLSLSAEFKPSTVAKMLGL